MIWRKEDDSAARLALFDNAIWRAKLSHVGFAKTVGVLRGMNRRIFMQEGGLRKSPIYLFPEPILPGQRFFAQAHDFERHEACDYSGVGGGKLFGFSFVVRIQADA